MLYYTRKKILDLIVIINKQLDTQNYMISIPKNLVSHLHFKSEETKAQRG